MSLLLYKQDNERCDPVQMERCRVAVHGDFGGGFHQCTRRSVATRDFKGTDVGMCTQHATAWDTWLAAKRKPRPRP
jgi:hypothetical protein